MIYCKTGDNSRGLCGVGPDNRGILYRVRWCRLLEGRFRGHYMSNGLILWGLVQCYVKRGIVEGLCGRGWVLLQM